MPLLFSAHGAETGPFAPRARDGVFAPRRGTGDGPASPGGDAPPIFFLKHQKEYAPCTVEKKKCFAQNGTLCLFCLCTGVPTRNCPVNFQSKRWARAQPCRIFQLVPRDELSANFGVVVVWLLLLFPRSPLRSALPVLNPGRGIQRGGAAAPPL